MRVHPAICSLLLAAAMLTIGCWGSSPIAPAGRNAGGYFNDATAVKLCQAISKHDLVAVERHIAAANVVGDSGMTPLLWALLEEDPEAVEALMKAGADPHVFVESDFGALEQGVGVFKGVAAIHVAASMQDPVYLKLLLENGADANLVANTVSKETPIFTVITWVTDVRSHLSLLVKHGSNLEYRRYGGVTPVNEATLVRGRFDVAKQLLEAGADYHGTTNGRTRLIHLLLRERAISRITPEQKKNYRDLLNWLEEHGESIEKAKAEVATGDY